MDTCLKAARARRRWGQQRLILELERAAAGRSVNLPRRASLKAQVSRWENGWTRPSEFYRELLRDVYQLADEELGFSTAPSSNDVVGGSINGAALSMPRLATQVSSELLACLREQLDTYARCDNRVGPEQVLSAVTIQANQLEQLLLRAPTPLRREVLELCVRYAEFTGWLHQDAGFMPFAQSWSDRAHDYAEELGNPQLRSYVLMRKSNLATDSGHAARAISLANAALCDRNQLTPRLRAVVLRQQALALALLRDEANCAAALDAAVVEASEGPVDDPTDPFRYCTSSYVLMESGGCWLQLHRPVKAVKCLEAALDGWPETFRRDRGLAMARLARALLANRELDKTCAVALDAAHVARSTASSRTNKQLWLLARGLAPYRQMPVVSEVQGELQRLT